jgi:RNA polymerase sigma factor (sigma-70 family)
MLRFQSKQKTEDISDETLLAHYVSDGSVRHLGLLYERYMPMVYGVCLKILKDPGKSEDAVIGIYEELTVKLKNHKVEAFRGWLYVLARNYCLMEWRRMQKQSTHYHPSEDMVQFDAVEAPFEYEFPKKEIPLQKCLDELSALQKLCVQWFYYEDKSYKDISDQIQEEVGKVRSYIQNGRRNLRICLEKPENNEA